MGHRTEQQPRVLVVDDDRTVRDAVVRALDTAGYATAACGSADRALELAGELRSDLVVLEMVLDGQVVGLELGRRLRRQADVLLVFATSHADVEDRLAAFEAGGDDYMVKLFRVEELVLRVRAVLRRTWRSAGDVLVVGRPGAAGVIRTVRGVGYMLHDDTVDRDPGRT